jgi:hypothetical protein
MADAQTLADMPGGDIEAASELAANKAYADAVTQLAGQRMNSLAGAGYLAHVDPTTGLVTNGGVDPNAQYGTFQTLLRNSAMEGEQQHNAAAGRGIGGGLAQQGEKQAAYDYGAGMYQLGNQMVQQGADYSSGIQSAANARVQAKLNARQQAAQAALQYQLQNTLLALPDRIAAQLQGSPAGAGGPMVGSGDNAPSTGIGPIAPGTNAGQGSSYKPTAPTGGGVYRNSGGTIVYQSNKGAYGSKPLA